MVRPNSTNAPATTIGGSRPNQVPAGVAGGAVGSTDGALGVPGDPVVAAVVGAGGLIAGEAIAGEGDTSGDAVEIGSPVVGSTVV